MGFMLIVGLCFISPLFLLMFLRMFAREQNEMTYLGAFFTTLGGMIVMPAVFWGLPDMSDETRALLASGSWLVVTVFMVNFVAHVGIGRALLTTFSFLAYTVAANYAIYRGFLEPVMVEASSR